jgi:hypothetical protein
LTRCSEVCAAYEAEFTKDAWRRTDRDRAAYLTHLVALGYTPCGTEQLMIVQTDTTSSAITLDDDTTYTEDSDD